MNTYEYSDDHLHANELRPLTFQSIYDSPNNPRLGLGYAQLFDKTHFVSLVAALPEVFRIGDKATLYWDDVEVQSYRLDEQHRETGFLSFAVSTTVVHPPEGKVYYTLFDEESDNLRTSPLRTIRVNLDVPGGLDQNTSTAINENLRPAKIRPSPVDSVDVPVTVEVPVWEHMEVGDELTVFWNGIPVKALPLKAVSIEKVLERALKTGILRRLFSRPLGNMTLESLFEHFSSTVKTLTAINEPQLVSIPRETLIQGGSGEALLVTYEIRDIVDNYSLVSLPAVVPVQIDPNALPAPYLPDADATTHQISLVKLGSNDAQVLVKTGPLSMGDLVYLTWTGRTPNAEVSETLGPLEVTIPDFEVLKFLITNANVRAFAGGSLSAFYTVYTVYTVGTVGTRKSKSANATVSGLIVQPVAPTVVGAVPGLIDLSVVTSDPVSVYAPAYAGQSAGDRISLIWSGTDAANLPVNYSTQYIVPAGGDANPVSFLVPRNNLSPLGGGTLLLTYQVVQAGSGNTVTSPATLYQVKAAAVAKPPALDVLQDNNATHVLDLTGLTQVTARVPDYGVQAGDVVTVRWSGVSQYDTASVVMPGSLDFNIPLALAQENANKPGGVTLTYFYQRGAAAVVTSVPLHITIVQQPIVLDLIEPSVVEARGDELDFTWLPNGTATVRVPAYRGMAVGHTVRVRWKSRVEYFTTIKKVTTVGPMDFVIPRDEVIDVIGSTVEVNYTVVVTTGAPIQVSKSYNLRVRQQAFNLVAPTINSNYTNVRIDYPGSQAFHTVVVRWLGASERHSGVLHPPGTGRYIDFTIDPRWVTENRGRTVLINYSVGVGEASLIFSQLLRVDIPTRYRGPRKYEDPHALGDLVFTDFVDTPENTRAGLGYHQLYDQSKSVSLIAMLPEVTRVGDTVTLYWDDKIVQTYNLDQAIIDRTWLSFSVPVSSIAETAIEGKLYYTLRDNESDNLETSNTRTVKINRKPPGGLDPNPATAINEKLEPCVVAPNPISDPNATVTVAVPPWEFQEEGDELTVMWNNIRVGPLTLGPLGPQYVTIPKQVLEDGGSSDKLMVNYEIRDIVDNYSLVSPATLVRVEIDPEALPAPRVVEANRTTMVLDLEALGDKDGHVLIPSYAGNEEPYLVTLDWKGKTPTAEIILTPSQWIEDPVYEQATFTIANADLKQIAGGSAVVRYTIEQDDAASIKTSKSTTITLTGLPVQLALPTVSEANGTAIIDLAQIRDPGVTVLIPAYIGQTEGDRILLSWKGAVEGKPPVNYTDEFVVGAGGELLDIIFLVHRENIDPLGGGKLELSYQVVFASTGSTQNSPVMKYGVTAVSLVFPAPTIVEAPSGILSPMKALAGATFSVTYGGMQTTDVIVPIWNGISDTILWAEGETDGTVQSAVPTKLIGPVINKTIDLQYQVRRGDQGFMSDVLKLKVEAISQTDLPTPLIAQASGGILDVGALAADADLTVAAWPFIAPGQIMWMVLRGSSTETLASWNGYVTGSAGAQSTKIPLEGYLQKLTDGSVLELVLEVSFDGGLTKHAFPITSYSVKIKPVEVPPVIASVADAAGRHIPNGGKTVSTSGSVAGTGYANTQIQLLSNGVIYQTLPVNAGGGWSANWNLPQNRSYTFVARTTEGLLTSNSWSFTINDPWADHRIDFSQSGSLGIWIPGAAFTQCRLVAGQGLRNDTTSASGHAGEIIHAAFEFKQGETYEFGFTAKNNDVSTWVQPELSVNIGGSELKREKFQTANWKTIRATFTAQSNQQQQLSINSWWDKGGGTGNTPEGGNDYTIHDIYVIKISE